MQVRRKPDFSSADKNDFAALSWAYASDEVVDTANASK